jgi:hypothetical protein
VSNDPKAAVRWLEEQAAKGEPPDSDDEFICPNTNTSQCNDGTGCTAC